MAFNRLITSRAAFLSGFKSEGEAISERTPREGRWRTVVFLAPILPISFFAFLKLQHPSLYYHEMIQEDNLLECLQFGFYLVAGCLAFTSATLFLETKHSVLGFLYLGLSLGLVVVSLEEISWGERIFGFSGPPIILENNYHNEFTVHNLNVLQPYLHASYIVVGSYAAFAWMILLFWRETKYKTMARFVIPDRILVLYFVPVVVVYFFFDYGGPFLARWLEMDELRVGGGLFVNRDQEPAELLLAVGSFLFVVMNKLELKRRGYPKRYSIYGKFKNSYLGRLRSKSGIVGQAR